MTYKIAVLPGDGIGPEVTEQSIRVLEATGLRFDFNYANIGFETYNREGTNLPDKTLEAITISDSALFGAVTTPIEKIEGYKSPILKLRQQLELYANIRPAISVPHENSRQGIDLIVVRENTEDLYSGIERIEDNGNRAITERVITREASERINRYAFEYAKKHNMSKVHAIHKANIMRVTCGLFLEAYDKISAEYPSISAEKMLVDTSAMELIRKPEQFQVIVTTNMFGDILSDISSQLTGGIGLAASGNIGERYSVFEPIHGSAPNLAGKNTANPIGTILAGAMMLEHLTEYETADRIRKAVHNSIRDKKVTPDLGGRLNTIEATNAIIERMQK